MFQLRHSSFVFLILDINIYKNCKDKKNDLYQPNDCIKSKL